MAPSVVVALLHFVAVLHHCSFSGGSSHWVVTEDGRVQSQMDTVFNMRRAYDLVAFMKQEERARMLEDLKGELLARKDEIDKNEDRDTGLEQRFYKTDPDCLSAGKPLPEFDLYISTVLPLENKGIRPEDYIDMQVPTGPKDYPPDCTLFSELDYSIHAFEHLEGMKIREMLSGTPELGLKNAITYQDDVDEYGKKVYQALQKNVTSWVLYNMAAFYWRIKGDPFHVIECVRRALHYSPQNQKDVALISLANVLHRARYSNEAAIAVHAALDISKERNVNHFTLGNIYAVLAEYNKSVICFENTLKIQPDFEAAAKRRNAVLCHAKLENALEAQHRSLQRTLNDLKDYQKKHDFWQTNNEKLVSEQVSTEVRMLQHSAYESVKIKDSNLEIGEYCRMVDKEGKQVLMCSWSKKSPLVQFYSFEEDEEKGPEIAATENVQTKTEEKVEIKDYSKPVREPLFTEENVIDTPKYTFPDNDWPSSYECDTYVKKVPDPRNLTTTYLSPENKGFEVKALLTEAQNLKNGDEHPLPWYPPVCVPLEEIPEGLQKTYDHIKSVSREERTRMPLKMTDKSMRTILLSHVNDGPITEEEVGQRILTALKQFQHKGANWILYNLAGLYWRIIGNNYHGIECIRRSLKYVPDKYKDVPLVNLANILYRWGRYEDAVLVMKDALAVCNIEPSSHLFFGNLLWVTKNYTGAVKHYQKALDIQPDNQHALNYLRAIKCYQKYQQATQSAAPPEDSTTPNSPNCPQQSSSKGQELESRVICKTENGEEKCVIETRSRSKSSECNGHCTQTCTVTPIKLDSCTGDVSIDTALGNIENSQCGQKGSGDSAEEPLFGGDFSSKLDEVSEYYLTKGICQGEECSQLRVQPGTQKPHIKLEFVNGILHQKLIFVNSPNDLPVEANECVIFNDGSKSNGCNQPEYRAYVDNFAEIQMILIHQAKSKGTFGTCNNQKEEHVKEPPAQDLPGSQDTPLKDGRAEIGHKPFPDQELPDTTVHISTKVPTFPQPLPEECAKLAATDFSEFTSTWLSVSAKGINLREHIDFDTVIKRDFLEPFCVMDETTETPSSDLDGLPGITQSDTLDYFSETALKEVLQMLGGESEPVGVVGTRIAHALKKNATSWVLTNVAGLYWRVEGDARRAIQCLRLSLTSAPTHVKDTSLISIANVLHRAGYINDAIVSTDLALHINREMVVSHFTMANLYAAKSQWEIAMLFYQSTLGLQESFYPAKQRLKSIMCKLGS